MLERRSRGNATGEALLISVGETNVARDRRKPSRKLFLVMSVSWDRGRLEPSRVVAVAESLRQSSPFPVAKWDWQEGGFFSNFLMRPRAADD